MQDLSGGDRTPIFKRREWRKANSGNAGYKIYKALYLSLGEQRFISEKNWLAKIVHRL